MMTGTRTRSRLALLVGFFVATSVLFVTASGVASADDGLTKKEATSLKRSLWKTAKDLAHVAKEEYIHRCGQCRGVGRIDVYEMQRRWNERLGEYRWVRVRVGDKACPTCNEKPYRINAELDGLIFHDLRTSAYRRTRPWRRNDRWMGPSESSRLTPREVPFYKMLYNIRKTEIVDRTHAVTWVDPIGYERDDIRWIREGEGKEARWCLYDARTDRPWPGEGGPRAAPAPTQPPTPRTPTLPSAVAKAVSHALPRLKAPFHLREYAVDRRTLVLHLWMDEGQKLQPDRYEFQLALDAVLLMRAVLPVKHDFGGLRVIWFSNWRDRLGRAAIRVTATAHMDTATARQVVWKNLLPEEQVALLEWNATMPQGFVPWPMPMRPKPDSKPGPTPVAGVDLDSARWVAWQEHTFPPRGTYEHGVKILAQCGRYAISGKLSTEPLRVDVSRGIGRYNASGGPDAPIVATLEFSASDPAPGTPVPAWIGVHLRLVYDVKLGIPDQASLGLRLIAGTEEIAAVRPLKLVKPKPVAKGREALVVTHNLSVAKALALVRAPRALLDLGDKKPVRIYFGAKGRQLLADLMSRLVR